MEKTSLIIGFLVCVTVAGQVDADPVSLVAADFSTLLGGAAAPVGVPATADMVSGSLKGQVISQAFTDGLGNYVFLYQLNNTGTAGNSVIEMLTLCPFDGASAATTLGYLTANPPTGFTLGDQAPAGASVDPAAGPTISFGFPNWLDEAVAPGETSETLYVLSHGPGGVITGNIINGASASGDVVGPVPEATSIALFGLGFAVLILARTPKEQPC